MYREINYIEVVLNHQYLQEKQARHFISIYELIE